ncbi:MULTISPECIES: antirepressor AbbA [Metabacillus]|jgi:hypothetical protein|uniref:Antirepressor AbbA n=1 Tax=Metabacillus hrfriensis TaxID=3048891 RepID=A0ACD4RGG1_9BACI|nr:MULTISPECIES: antirepressor AbbA [Metabacillus]UOK59383.1 antirepressor AbbA [Bacillus sp. OVS6]USK30323.1 antirepressor AbbA [Bacillus sp. CMF21]USK35450.1 antirepressor AbbA [Bacillus sp. F19]UAL54006.1 antirepressor AbbA [Metabacillus dongyingensis]WHZ59572.1 antirepressor AbbA [Metabacillus sp. CT-WN-B3]
MNSAVEILSSDDQKFLVELLLKQQYALELISSEIYEIESGTKQTDNATYQKLVSLYDRIRFEL